MTPASGAAVGDTVGGGIEGDQVGWGVVGGKPDASDGDGRREGRGRLGKREEGEDVVHGGLCDKGLNCSKRRLLWSRVMSKLS